ncbi:sulfite exporter TauE/SafE family protein [uncultured Oxalicibacterium sp.]|uniref:sulfite exporter TauE/SafE family protein n=1 Tax=uncultured Oxalicibacterium sp. TaxID=1168540 RepID=UPI0025F5C3BD|nr:sulfite exporter TauE/SafE family protein [uncultured Oxalicibacterium sp.]
MVLTLLLGAGVGLVMGLTGAGGSILAVPALMFGLHLGLAQAGPIALFAVGIAAAIGSLFALHKEQVRYRAAILIAASGVVCAPVGIWLSHHLPTTVVAILFALVLLWVGINNILRARHKKSEIVRGNPICKLDSVTGRFRWNTPCAAILCLAGAGAGILSALLGVGGGFVIVPVLQRVANLPMRTIVATSLSIVALISLTGVLTIIGSGRFSTSLALPFTAAVLIAMVFGGKLGDYLPARHLRAAFGFLSLLIGGMLLWRTLI